ncbi:MAG: helix-turn-helix transcriptional regulator [Clostridia bacterium]|nr:helix-turn-helix transcriptional regulator [Clostridia bacterium]
MTMGERITALRKGRGMTQEQLAERLSVTRQSVSKWELDQATPEVGFAVALCELFGVSLDYLIRGIEPEPVAETGTADESVPPPGEPEKRQELLSPTSKPLTVKGYAMLFAGVFLLAELLCINLYPVAVLLDKEVDFTMIFVLLYAVVIPLPAVYLATNRWWYTDRRHALKHLWKITAGVAVVANLVLIGSYEFYFCHVYNGLEYAFWQTDWITAEYQWLVGEIIVLAVLMPILVCFRHKKWLCWLAYALSWLALFWSEVILDALVRLIPNGLGRYWGLADVGVYFLIMGIVLLSQLIVSRRLRGEPGCSEAVSQQPWTIRRSVGVAVICAIAVVSVMGGLHYALDLAGLPTVYMPMAYVMIPLLALMLSWGRRAGNACDVWRFCAILLGSFLPLMLLGHMGVCYFFQRFYACLGPMPALNWGGYLTVSLASALVGGLIAVPSMIALRKRPRTCILVGVGILFLTCAAALLLPRILV